MKETKPKNIFRLGAISPGSIGESIAMHATRKEIGAHSIFLGQVRADTVDGKMVRSIEYTAYEEMALQQMHLIRQSAFATYNLTCLHVHHSLGTVRAGEISLFVFASSAHRKEAAEACAFVVERIKAELAVWGKEIFEDLSHQWKQNT